MGLTSPHVLSEHSPAWSRPLLRSAYTDHPSEVPRPHPLAVAQHHGPHSSISWCFSQVCLFSTADCLSPSFGSVCRSEGNRQINKRYIQEHLLNE